MSSPLCHFELMVADAAKAQAFYGSVFGWKFDTDSMPGYTLIDTGHEPTGAIFAAPEGAGGVCANIYFKVADIDATLETATKSGAKVLVPRTEIPGVGFFAMFTDPEGIPVGIMQPNE